jgi:hypothetical protein
LLLGPLADAASLKKSMSLRGIPLEAAYGNQADVSRRYLAIGRVGQPHAASLFYQESQKKAGRGMPPA